MPSAFAPKDRARLRAAAHLCFRAGLLLLLLSEGRSTADQRALRRPQSWVVRAPSRVRGCFGRDPAATRNRCLCSGLSNDSRGPITWFYGSAEAVASKSRRRPPDGCNSHLSPSLPLCLQRASVPHPCPCKVSAKAGPSERALVCRG